MGYFIALASLAISFIVFFIGWKIGWDNCYSQWGRAYMDMRQITKDQDKRIDGLQYENERLKGFEKAYCEMVPKMAAMERKITKKKKK